MATVIPPSDLRDELGHASRAAIAFDGEDHALQIGNHVGAERLHGMKRASGGAETRERREDSAIERGAGVQNDFTLAPGAADGVRALRTTDGKSSSAVVRKITSAAKIDWTAEAKAPSKERRLFAGLRPRASTGVPAPMMRTAARAVRAERVTTAPIRQPRRRRRLPRVLPTRPAPTMETVRAMQRDSIT